MNITEISDCRGLGPQLLFGLDTISIEDKVVCHFVRFETIVFDKENFDPIEFKVVHPDNDERLSVFTLCIQ